MSRRLALVVLALALPVCVAGRGDVAQAPAAPAAAASSWRAFGGTFTATGRRHTVPTEDGGLAASVYLSGSLVITGGEGLRRGFRVEAVGFEDMAGTGTGRAVWTDDAGDRVFSRMVGIPTQAGRRSMATITGGTGRYAGITGGYSFTWQYVLPGEQGVIQARAVSLKGQYRVGVPR